MIRRIRNLPLKERIRLYNEVVLLRKKNGWGYVKIGRSLSIPIDVVRHWLHHGRDPRRHGRMHMFKGDPSPELAYVIGVCQGDADLPKVGKSRERVGQKIRLRAIDKDFVKTFATKAEEILLQY